MKGGGGVGQKPMKTYAGGRGFFPKTYVGLRNSEGIHFRSVVIFSILKKVETLKIDLKNAYKNCD